MKAAIFLGVSVQDWCTTVAAYSETGNILAMDVAFHEALKPAGGLAEQPLDAYWNAFTKAVQGVLASPAVAPTSIAALAIAADPMILVALDRSGTPLHNAILPRDKRATKAAVEVTGAFSVQEFYRTTGVHRLDEYSLPAKIHWLVDNAPKVADAAARYSFLQDNLSVRLGGAPFVEHSLASRTGLYDLDRGTWWERLLTFLEMAPERLPHIGDAGQVLGTVSDAAAAATGLPRGAVIALGVDNSTAAALATDTARPGQMVICTLQTLTGMLVTDRPALDRQRRFGTATFPCKDLWSIHASIRAGEGLLSWYRQTFAPHLTFAQLDALAAAAPAGCDELLVLPRLRREGHPLDAGGVVAGIGVRHNKEHLVRAMMEGEACALRAVIDMLNQAKLPVSVVSDTSGSSKSDFWMQVKADVAQLPVVRIKGEHSACLGAAICAAVGAGMYDTVHKAARAMHGELEEFTPDPAHARVYRDVYDHYKDLIKRMEE